MIGISGQLIFLDVETTGLSPRWDRIIEIFLVSLQKDGEVRELGTLINPERPIPARITELTGLTDRDVAQAPLESEIAAEIRDFIGFGLPVAHNLPFDRGFLNAMFRRNNLLEIGDAGLDTLAISRELFPPKLCIYPGGWREPSLKQFDVPLRIGRPVRQFPPGQGRCSAFGRGFSQPAELCGRYFARCFPRSGNARLPRVRLCYVSLSGKRQENPPLPTGRGLPIRVGCLELTYTPGGGI